MRSWARAVVVLACLASSAAWAATPAEGKRVRAPMVCSRGSEKQFFDAVVTVPETVPAGATYSIRIDSVPCDSVRRAGLNYLHAMITDYLVPTGTSYVEGSAHLVPGTGSENVRASASVWHEAGVVHLLLTAHVTDAYTPPSIELQVKVGAPVGTTLPLKFAQHRLKANVVFLGDLNITCDPTPKPLTIGATRVTPP